MVVGMLEGPDLIIVLVIVMVMFGAKRLPELARGLGQAKREFESATSETEPKLPVSSAAIEVKAAENGSVTLSHDEYTRLTQLDQLGQIADRDHVRG
jgi:TatA/E family protein of Tat protein translocase